MCLSHAIKIILEFLIGHCLIFEYFFEICLFYSYVNYFWKFLQYLLLSEFFRIIVNLFIWPLKEPYANNKKGTQSIVVEIETRLFKLTNNLDLYIVKSVAG